MTETISLCTALELAARAQEAASVSASASAFALAAGGAELRIAVDGKPKALPDRDAAAVIDRLGDLGIPTRHTVVLRGDEPARHELYFDAQIRGRWIAAAIVEEALGRLGFDRVWPSLAAEAVRRGPYLDEVQAFAIELVDGKPQVTVFVSHHDATADDVRAALGSSALAARAGELCIALTGSAGPYRAGAIVTAHAFADPAAAAPASHALHVPVAAYAAGNDTVVRGRITALLATLGLSVDAYERARRPGISVGVREDRAGLAAIVDLASPAPAPLHAATQATTAPTAEEIVRRFEHDILLADHPYLRRLAREPVDLGRLWLIVANFWEGIVSDFPARLARIVANADDDRVRCVMVKQLNDELGEGDFSRAHKAMYRAFLEAVAAFRLPGSDDVLLAPGRAFGQTLETHLFSTDLAEVIGAMMMVEIYGKQVDQFMGSQFRRQDKLDASALQWLHLHENLEVDHADDSLTLARYIPNEPAAIAAAWRGAEGVVAAGRAYFDAFYRIVFA